MSRGTLILDRFVGLLLALVLIAAGAVTALWSTRQVARLAAPLDITPVRDAIDESWWPWALAGVGILLVALGLAWLLAHRPQTGVGRIPLPGTGRPGRLLAEGRPVADAAAAALAPTLGVQRVRGRIRRERGTLVLRLNALLDPDADLGVVTDAAEQVSGQVRHLLGRDDLTCTVSLQVASHITRRTRVS
jgi:hypothetical protein